MTSGKLHDQSLSSAILLLGEPIHVIGSAGRSYQEQIVPEAIAKRANAAFARQLPEPGRFLGDNVGIIGKPHW
jgi:hypothetical protein